MTCPDIGYSMPRKKFDSGKIRVLILNVYAACPEPDTSPYSRFSQEYGFVSTNIGTMTQLTLCEMSCVMVKILNLNKQWQQLESNSSILHPMFIITATP